MNCRRCAAQISDDAQICCQCGLADPRAARLFPRRSPSFKIAVSMLDGTPAGPLIRRILGRESLYALRERLARKYLHGSGIEFGALNAALKLPNNATVKYADIQTPEQLKVFLAQYERITVPDIVTDIQTMAGIEDRSLDFVIANHVLEHVENPLSAFRAIARTLRRDGIAFIALPDKRFTFDRKRPITPLAHLIKDYKEGPAWGRAEHYDDWVENAEGLHGKERRERAAYLMASNTNIHFHVWDYESMEEMFDYVVRQPDIGFVIAHSQQNQSEGLWILRKRH